MEYVILGIYTFVSVLNGIIVGVIWFVKAEKANFKKRFIDFIYIFFSLSISSLRIRMMGILLN